MIDLNRSSGTAPSIEAQVACATAERTLLDARRAVVHQHRRGSDELDALIESLAVARDALLEAYGGGMGTMPDGDRRTTDHLCLMHDQLRRLRAGVATDAALASSPLLRHRAPLGSRT